MKPRPLTDDERNAISALRRVSRRWPRTLTLASMGGALVVVSTDDVDFQDGTGPERSEGVHAYIDGIPNTGGDW